jgi:putative DNA primase/helicase
MPDKPDLSVLHNKFKTNTVRFPAILQLLAEDLGVTLNSLQRLGVGFYPGHQSWVFPERDETGKIVGLMERYPDGKKFMLKGSKRGLIYEVNNGKENYEKKNWVRVSQENPCPLCGKADGCMYPEGEYNSPAAVVCVHISDGSKGPLSSDAPGYLHILDPKRNSNRSKQQGLGPSDFPVLVVEGASDVATGLDLDFVTVGRPSAEGGIAFLRGLLPGRDIVVIGENDAGAGISGMESTFKGLKDVCKSIIKILPPEGIKDLRIWKNEHGLSQEILLDYILKTGDKTSNKSIFEDDVASTIAEAWIKQEETKNGVLLLRSYEQKWVEFTGKCYDFLSPMVFRGKIYKFLKGKKFFFETPKGDIITRPYKPTKCKISDIIDPLGQWCEVTGHPPIWLTDKPKPDPVDLIVFQNGILDVNEYAGGKIVVYNPTPELFTTYVLPYNFDEDLDCGLWDDYLKEIFNNDQEAIRLLAQWFGYNCVPDMSYEKLMFLHGQPRSGKGTVLEALRETVGERQCGCTSITSLAGQFSFQPMLGKLSTLLADSRSPKNHEVNTVLEKLLLIVGGDAVNVNRKFLDEIASLHLHCRFTLAMNELPVFVDHARSLEPKLNIVSFKNTYVGREDFSLKRHVIKEAAKGKLINFALRGLKDLRTQKRFFAPKSSSSLFNQFRDIASPVFSFIDTCLEVIKDPEEAKKCWVPKNQLFDLWKGWCTNQGREHGFKESFGRRLLATCPEISVSRRNMSGDRFYGFQGIKITKEAFKEYFNV